MPTDTMQLYCKKQFHITIHWYSEIVCCMINSNLEWCLQAGIDKNEKPTVDCILCASQNSKP